MSKTVVVIYVPSWNSKFTTDPEKFTTLKGETKQLGDCKEMHLQEISVTEQILKLLLAVATPLSAI